MYDNPIYLLSDKKTIQLFLPNSQLRGHKFHRRAANLLQSKY